jgi:ABC-type antimicrobial peptide transport system, ATPase component
MPPVVSTVKLAKVYRIKKIEYQALRGVDMEVEKGEFVAIVGPSGSGKTTLLDMVGLLDSPTSGKVFINGVDTTLLNERRKAELRNKHIGFVFQSYNLITYLTVLENVELPLAVSGIPFWRRKRRAEEVLSAIPGMLELKDKKPNELSGGQQQRLAIARALVNDPELLIADEPTANLDTKTGEAVVKLLKSLSTDKGVTILMATHDPDMIRNCDRVIYIRDGLVEKVVEQ